MTPGLHLFIERDSAAVEKRMNQMAEEGNIIVKRAKVNNLKDVTVEIPRGKFVVVTGISGSGKSSLAFDTLFAEGQRRFAESLSSYARQFLGRMSKPDVELIEGIPPAIAIEQKVNTRNPRSTVATSTEIYDYLRMIFARIGRTYSPVTGEEVKCHTANDVLSYIYEGGASAAYILADLDWNARPDKVELMLQLKEEGYSRFFTDRAIRIEDVMKMAESGEYPSELYLLIDRLKLSHMEEDLQTRLHSSIETAFSKEILDKAFSSGLRMIMWGLESGSDKVLELINKGIDLNKRFDILKDSKEAGIWNFAFIFFGFPTETQNDAKMTVQMLVDNKDIIHSYGRSVFTMGRHAKLAENPDKYGITKIYPAEEEFSPNINFDSIGMNKQELGNILEYCKIQCSIAYKKPLWMFLRYREWLFLYVAKYGTDWVKNFDVTEQRS